MKKQNRKSQVIIALCAFLALFTMLIVSNIHFFFGPNDSKTIVSTSKDTVSVVRWESTPSSSAKISSAAEKAVQVSIQEAVTPLWIYVSIKDQTLMAFDADNRTVKNWLCSTGSPGYDTPRGTFSIYKRGKSFYNPEYQEGAYYYVAFYKDYYIHSVPFDKDRNVIPTIANDLGHQDSHGCIHLTIEDSKWIYDNIPDETRVIID